MAARRLRVMNRAGTGPAIRIGGVCPRWVTWSIALAVGGAGKHYGEYSDQSHSCRIHLFSEGYVYDGQLPFQGNVATVIGHRRDSSLDGQIIAIRSGTHLDSYAEAVNSAAVLQHQGRRDYSSEFALHAESLASVSVNQMPALCR
jgi:hypothetical protein